MKFSNIILKGFYFTCLTAGLLTATSCDDDDDNSDGPVMMEDPEGMTGSVTWNYDELGPSVWGTLSDTFMECSIGEEQSPINLESMGIEAMGPDTGLTFNYSTTATLDALNNTHTNEFVVDTGSSVMFNGKQFNLAQFHGHAESEHEINGEQSPLELHFVHQAEDGELLVAGVLINQGEENENYTSFWTPENFLPTEETSVTRRIEGTHDLTTLLPVESPLYQYAGSLTTPPCTEGVNWNVFTETITMSSEQIELFTNIFDNNYRPVQPLNDREVTSTMEPAVESAL